MLAFLQRSKPPAASTITRLRRRSSATSDTHSSGLQRRSEAQANFASLLDIATGEGAKPSIPIFAALAGIALAANPADTRQAARLRGAVVSLRRTAKHANAPRSEKLERHFEQPIIEALGAETWAQEQASGATMTLDEAIALARTLARAEVPTD